MYTADLDPCKELYHLTKWQGTQNVYWFKQEPTVFDADEWVVSPRANVHQEHIPAYDAGFLLDKLVEVKTGLTLYHVHSTMQWEAFYAGKFFEYGPGEQHWSTQDSSPANALCLLAISLIKQGVLNPKGEA